MSRAAAIREIKEMRPEDKRLGYLALLRGTTVEHVREELRRERAEKKRQWQEFAHPPDPTRCRECGSPDHKSSIIPPTGGWPIRPVEVWRAWKAPRSVYRASEYLQTCGRVYFLEATGADRIKIGWTAGDPKSRIAGMVTACPFPLKLLATLVGTVEGEKWLHAKCKSAHAHGEWFHATDDLRALVGVLACMPGYCTDMNGKR